MANVRIFVKHSRSVIAVKNTDHFCQPKALVIGETLASEKRNGTSQAAMFIRDRYPHSYNSQHSLAVRLCNDASVQIGPQASGYEELVKFQEYYADRLKITVFKD